MPRHPLTLGFYGVAEFLHTSGSLRVFTRLQKVLGTCTVSVLKGFFHTQNFTRPGEQIHPRPRIKAGDARRGAGAKTRPVLRTSRNRQVATCLLVMQTRGELALDSDH
jgi:hypothetical protein